MGFGTKTNFWSAHYFKIIVEWETPHFRKWNDEDTQYTYLDGEFEKIEFKTIEFADKSGKQQTRRVFDLVLTGQDDKWQNEKYVLSSGFTSLSRTMLNCLLSATDWLWFLKISVYKNKSWYNSIYMENDGKRLERKYTMDEMKAKTKPILDPDTQEVLKIKYDDLEKFLEEEVTKLSKKEEKF